MKDDSRGFWEDESGKYWGLYGAAGVLLRCPDPHDGQPLVLMQHRGLMGHFGGTWGLPGGAKDSHESAIEAALRELNEETGIDTEQISVIDQVKTFASPSGWTYTTVIAETESMLPLQWDHESLTIEWTQEEKILSLNLHPSFRASWHQVAITAYTTPHPTQRTRILPSRAGYKWSLYPK